MLHVLLALSSGPILGSVACAHGLFTGPLSVTVACACSSFIRAFFVLHVLMALSSDHSVSVALLSNCSQSVLHVPYIGPLSVSVACAHSSFIRPQLVLHALIPLPSDHPQTVLHVLTCISFIRPLSVSVACAHIFQSTLAHTPIFQGKIVSYLLWP